MNPHSTRVSWQEFFEILQTSFEAKEAKSTANLHKLFPELQNFIMKIYDDSEIDPAGIAELEWKQIYTAYYEKYPKRPSEIFHLIRKAYHASDLVVELNKTRTTKTIPENEYSSDCMTYWMGEYLKKQKWQNVKTIYDNQNITDITAEKNNQPLIVYVKHPNGVSSNIIATIGTSIIRLLNEKKDKPNLKLAIALPDKKIFEAHLRGILPHFPQMNIITFWISKDTSIRLSKFDKEQLEK